LYREFNTATMLLAGDHASFNKSRQTAPEVDAA
jgi:hypothetical protein